MKNALLYIGIIILIFGIILKNTFTNFSDSEYIGHLSFGMLIFGLLLLFIQIIIRILVFFLHIAKMNSE